MFQNELMDHRHKQLPQDRIEVVNQALKLRIASVESGLVMVALALLYGHNAAFS